MRRTLVLKKETLTELSPGELGRVAGGNATPRCPTWECPIPTDHCATINQRCISEVIDPCVTATCTC